MTEIDDLVEVALPDDSMFLKLIETLTRIGIATRNGKILYQTCHILHKRGKYYIVHFKELFILDGKKNTFDKEDAARRNGIIKLLEEWNMVTVVTKDNAKTPTPSILGVKVLPFSEKTDWTLIPKYTIGNKRRY